MLGKNGRRETDSFSSSSSSSSRLDRSEYASTSRGVKVLVGGLTSIINGTARVLRGRDDTENVVPDRDVIDKDGLTPTELLEGIRDDFSVRGYLFTGEITEHLYDAACVFEDPTLRFTGLATFRYVLSCAQVSFRKSMKNGLTVITSRVFHTCTRTDGLRPRARVSRRRNLRNLQPILRALLADRRVELLSATLDERSTSVIACWRMYGELRLPWRPCIDLSGRTVFSYSAERGGRIVEYLETWDLPATEALRQLLTPSMSARTGAPTDGVPARVVSDEYDDDDDD